MISPVETVNMRKSVNYVLPHKKSLTSQMVSPVPEEKSVNSLQALSQMPNISFKAGNVLFVEEGQYPSETEQRIARLSRSAEQDIKMGNLLTALVKELQIAQMYGIRGRFSDENAQMIVVKRIFGELPDNEKLRAIIFLNSYTLGQ